MEIFDKFEQGSTEWLKIRAGMLTGTKLGNLMSGKLGSKTFENALENLIYTLIGEEFSYDENVPQIKNYLMEQGNFFEGVARAKYYEKNPGEKILEVGFIRKNEFLGISPDGVNESFTKGVEIKCPLGNNSKNFYKYMFEDIIPDEYLRQVVHYFIVIDTLEELDFVVYNPNFILENKMWVKNIKREDLKNEIQEAKERIIILREKWLEKINLLLKNG